jgi:two-component system response regulator HupR/HoxA
MDIPLIAADLLDLRRGQAGRPGALLAPEALRCLERYAWPGNVRELQNEIMRLLALADDDILGADLLSPAVRGQRVDGAAVAADDSVTITLKHRVERIEADVIRETLTRLRGNKSRAAEELGLSRVGLRAKLARYGLENKR